VKLRAAASRLGMRRISVFGVVFLRVAFGVDYSLTLPSNSNYEQVGAFGQICGGDDLFRPLSYRAWDFAGTPQFILDECIKTCDKYNTNFSRCMGVTVFQNSAYPDETSTCRVLDTEWEVKPNEIKSNGAYEYMGEAGWIIPNLQLYGPFTGRRLTKAYDILTDHEGAEDNFRGQLADLTWAACYRRKNTCGSAPSNCASLNRYDCVDGARPNVCGFCKPGYRVLGDWWIAGTARVTGDPAQACVLESSAVTVPELRIMFATGNLEFVSGGRKATLAGLSVAYALKHDWESASPIFFSETKETFTIEFYGFSTDPCTAGISSVEGTCPFGTQRRVVGTDVSPGLVAFLGGVWDSGSEDSLKLRLASIGKRPHAVLGTCCGLPNAAKEEFLARYGSIVMTPVLGWTQTAASLADGEKHMPFYVRSNKVPVFSGTCLAIILDRLNYASVTVVSTVTRETAFLWSSLQETAWFNNADPWTSEIPIPADKWAACPSTQCTTENKHVWQAALLGDKRTVAHENGGTIWEMLLAASTPFLNERVFYLQIGFPCRPGLRVYQSIAGATADFLDDCDVDTAGVLEGSCAPSYMQNNVIPKLKYHTCLEGDLDNHPAKKTANRRLDYWFG
jgi:hypothetical protein